MPEENIQYEVHNYDPLNKYIDERSRVRRTRSVWGYTKSLALFLIALGVFLVLAAYAYDIFKKPHQLGKIDQQQNENINKEIINKNREINQVEEEIEKNPENQELQQKLEELQKEKEEIEKKLEEQSKRIVDGKEFKYNLTTHQFETVDIDVYSITTRRKYPKTTDLLEQTGNYTETCYLAKGGSKFEYDRSASSQSSALNALGITADQARIYEKYCKRTK